MRTLLLAVVLLTACGPEPEPESAQTEGAWYCEKVQVSCDELGVLRYCYQNEARLMTKADCPRIQALAPHIEGLCRQTVTRQWAVCGWGNREP